MKKFYLFLIVTVVATMVSAKVSYDQKYSNMKHNTPTAISLLDNSYEVTVDQEATDYVPYQAPRLKDEPGEGDTFYYRPYGTFYVGYNPMESRVYPSPYLYLPPYRDVTFRGSAVGDWSYQKYDRSVSGRPWQTVEGQQDLTVRFSIETDSVPYIYGGGTEYFLFGYNSDSEKIPSTVYAHNDLSTRLASGANGREGWFASPVFWASRDRNLTYTSSTRYVTGAKDVDGGTTAFWFGKNFTGWNACAIYCEKPENPYVLRGVAIRYAYSICSEPVDLTVKVYKVVSHEPREVAFGELLARGTATLPASDEQSAGCLYFPLVEYDEEFDLELDVELEVDYDIYVVLSGYDNDAISKFAVPLSSDIWDEGIGETGYNLMLDENGEIAQARGLTVMFTGFKGYSAPGIFLDVIYPFLINNYSNDKSVRKYDAEGTLIYDGTETLYYGSNFSAYTTKSSEDWEITLADGSDVPDWLTLTPEDEIEDNAFTGEVNVGIEVEPLPEGLAGRKAVVRFKIPGHYHDLTIIQGEEPVDVVPGDVNGDGVCNAADVTALYNWILNNDNSALKNGDQNNDDIINAGDVTTVYNIILGN